MQSLGQLASLTESLAERYRPLIEAELQLPTKDSGHARQWPAVDGEQATKEPNQAATGRNTCQALPHGGCQPAGGAGEAGDATGPSSTAVRQGHVTVAGVRSCVGQHSTSENGIAGANMSTTGAAAPSGLLVLEQVSASQRLVPRSCPSV